MVKPLGWLLAVAALASWAVPASALEYAFKADANVLDVWKAPPGAVEELGKGVRVETADGVVTLATDKANLFLYHPERVADGTVELAAQAQWPNPFGLLGRYNPATTDGILALVDPGAKKVVLARLDKGKRQPLAEAPLAIDPRQAFTLTLRLEGDKVAVSINGVEQASAVAADAPKEGVAGLFGQWYTRLRPTVFRVGPLAAAAAPPGSNPAAAPPP